MAAETDVEIVEELCAIEAGLSGRELDFIEDMARLVESGRSMTEKQRAWAEAIAERSR